MSVSPIPDGYHSITPYLIVKEAAKAIDFYKRAMGATEVLVLDGPGGTIMHAEIKIGDSHVMLADEFPDMNILAPQNPGNCGVGICLYVPNVDEAVATAIDAGCQVQRPLEDQFYGDRSATLEDPFGHRWTISTHIEDVSHDEIRERMQQMMGGPPEA